MPFATAAQLEQAIGTEAYLRVVDRDADGEPDTVSIDEALERATSVATSYIPPAFLPVQDPAPAVLVDAVVWIGWYYVAGERFTTYQRQRYEDAIRWLERVQAGKATLGLPPAPTAPSSNGSAELVTSPRVMTRAALGRLL